jgi:hypothetical protein
LPIQIDLQVCTGRFLKIRIVDGRYCLFHLFGRWPKGAGGWTVERGKRGVSYGRPNAKPGGVSRPVLGAM